MRSRPGLPMVAPASLGRDCPSFRHHLRRNGPPDGGNRQCTHASWIRERESNEMNRPPSPLRVAAGLVLAVVATIPAACGGPATTAVTATDGSSFNQTLHDRLPQSIRDRGVLRVGTDASYAPMSS